MTSENKLSSFDFAAVSQPSQPKPMSQSKGALIHQALQTQGIEVQEEIEKEVALALHNYRHSINGLRKNLFQPRVDLKNQIRELHKRVQERRAIKEEPKPLKISTENQEDLLLVFTLSLDSFPLTTRHYIASASNIRADNSSTLNLLNFGAFKFFSDMTFKNDLHYLIREMGEPEARVQDLSLHKLNFVCKFVAERMKSTDFSIMVILAKMLGKSPQCLLKFWLRIQKTKVVKRPQKIFAYKNSQYFCTMCRKYICNLHFEEGPVLFVNKEPDFEYSPYFTRFTVAYDKEAQRENKVSSKKMKIYDDEELTPSYHLLYKCPKGIESGCYMKDSKRDESTVGNFEEYEEEFILNYCLKYGFTNPCAIRFLLNNPKRTCWEINYFISKKHASSPRNTLPKSLIENVKLTKSELALIKSKKGPKCQEWGNYRPCFHPGEPCKSECACTEFGSCEIFCGCPRDCPLRFQGCNCKPGRCVDNSNCPCMRIGRNCDPELCKSCSSEINLRLVKKRNSKVVACPNTALLYRQKPRLLLGRSEICEGMGIYAGQNFEKGDFIGEYVGELISESEGQIRGSMYGSLGCSYMFNYDSESSVDAYFYGNKIRFVNHGIGKYENSFPKYIFVRGGVRIGLFAMKDIKIGQEILFNYGTDYQLEWLLEYNKQVEDEMKKERDAKKRKRRKRLTNIVLFEEKETPENFLKFLDDA